MEEQLYQNMRKNETNTYEKKKRNNGLESNGYSRDIASNF